MHVHAGNFVEDIESAQNLCAANVHTREINKPWHLSPAALKRYLMMWYMEVSLDGGCR